MTDKKQKKQPRIHKFSITLNEREYIVFKNYIKKYKISNKSQVIREALFTHILKKFDDDYPSLFDDINKE